MPANVNNVVAERSDLSTFVVHFTRDISDGLTAWGALRSIINSGVIEARTPRGVAVDFLGEFEASEGAIESQRVVCFTETPLEHSRSLLRRIEERQIQLQPYGIAIPKKLARLKQIRPVWYLDITRGGGNWLSEYTIRPMVQALVAAGYENSHLSKMTPFWEVMGSGSRGRDGAYTVEFWWEREWRHLGDLPLDFPYLGLCPAAEIDTFENFAAVRGRPAKFVDPTWSVERIIAKLAGFSDRQTLVGKQYS